MIPKINDLKFSDEHNFFLIAGPCVVENEEVCFAVAEHMLKLTSHLRIPYIFKASYRKANRSRKDSFTGIGDVKALEILAKVKAHFNIPVLTDIHAPEEAELAAAFVDVLQIPAFLARQTDLLVAAASTGKYVNIKKGQFMSPESMQFAFEKVKDSGNDKIMLTDRGTMFGYNDLIVDFRSIPVMQTNACPVILDVTHSLQQPNTASGVTGGRPEMIKVIASAGIAAGADGLFIEIHPDPSKALSDGANMLKLSDAEALLKRLCAIRLAVC
jgi:2-dehydro-3-deoxyphosphooctonate aldolase (KDO 8-P synthase)